MWKSEQISRAICIAVLLSIATSCAMGQERQTWSLKDCITHALQHNISVKDAELAQDASEIDLKQSKWQRMPNLSGSASQSLTNGNSIDPITSDYVTKQIHSTSVGLSSQLTLYQGSKLANQIKQNKLLLEQNSFYVQEAKNSIILSITEAFVQAMYNWESIGIAQDALAISEKQLESARIRYEAGATASKDFVDAQSQLATSKYNLINARNNYEMQILTLKQLLELEPGTPFEIADADLENTEVALIPKVIDVYQKALGSRPEIRSSEVNIAVNEKGLAIAKGSYLPTLALSGSLGTGYTSTQNLSFIDQFDFNFNQRATVSLSVPIYNRHNTKYQVQTAKVNIERAKLKKATAEKALFRNVETAWQNATASQEKLIAAKAALVAAKAAYDLSKKQQELGSLSTFDLGVAQNTYTNAEQNVVQAKYLTILYTQLLDFYQNQQ
ncbi:MAG: TolC family protein [Flavobacteriales bacterium]|nr:TolC family protein [Flavobacteriales bacterium]